MNISLSHVTLSPKTSTRGTGVVVAAWPAGAAWAAETARLGMAAPAKSAHVSNSRQTVLMVPPCVRTVAGRHCFTWSSASGGEVRRTRWSPVARDGLHAWDKPEQE